MALEEETAQEGTPVDPQEPHVQPMETAPEGPKDVAHEGPGDVAHGGPGEVAHGGPGKEESEEVGLLGIAHGGLIKAAPVEPEEHEPNKTQKKKTDEEEPNETRCTEWAGKTYPASAHTAGWWR